MDSAEGGRNVATGAFLGDVPQLPGLGGEAAGRLQDMVGLSLFLPFAPSSAEDQLQRRVLGSQKWTRQMPPSVLSSVRQERGEESEGGATGPGPGRRGCTCLQDEQPSPGQRQGGEPGIMHSRVRLGGMTALGVDAAL